MHTGADTLFLNPPRFPRSLSVACCWLLAVGCWLLAVGCCRHDKWVPEQWLRSRWPTKTNNYMVRCHCADDCTGRECVCACVRVCVRVCVCVCACVCVKPLPPSVSHTCVHAFVWPTVSPLQKKHRLTAANTRAVNLSKHTIRDWV